MKQDLDSKVQEKLEEKLEESQETSIATSDFYQNSLKNEQKDVAQRSEQEDQEVFGQICNEIRSHMKEILKLKTDKKDQWQSSVEDHKVKVMMLTLSLRKLSRIQKVRAKNEREMTVDNRQSVDGVTLQLQNLLYEVSHLKKEVRKCLEFQAADQEIDLVSVDQFYKEAPENISRPDETVGNKHQQHLAQLHWELEQRRGQTQLFDKLTLEKNKVSAIISEQETKLSSLAPRIDTILEATQPLQKSLNLHLDSKREQQKISQWLPSPLYTLWVQLLSYGEACDNSLVCEIEGDVEAASKLAVAEEDSKMEASDSENELDQPEENRGSRKSRNRSEKRNKETETAEETLRKHVLSLHPLHLIFKVKLKDENCISIKFCYAQVLKIVTTFCTLELKHKETDDKSLLSDILKGDTFLNLLYPGDTGLSSPNPANEFHFKKIGCNSLTVEIIKLIGRPYKWAQTLSGISFLVKQMEEQPETTECTEDLDLDDNSESEYPTVSPVKKPDCNIYSQTVSWKLSAENVHVMVTHIKRRLQSRLSLHAQLMQLETAKSTNDIPLSSEVLLQHFPGKVSSDLHSWKPVAYEDYAECPSTENFVKKGLVNSNFLTFKAIFGRQSASLEALVAISPDYPNEQPIFSLTLMWDKKEETAIMNPHIRQMESEVNVHWIEMVSTRSDKYTVLSLQLYRLAMCFDIFTEATSIHCSAAKVFHKEKIFFRPSRGPDRSLPFKYLPKLGVFAQR